MKLLAPQCCRKSVLRSISPDDDGGRHPAAGSEVDDAGVGAMREAPALELHRYPNAASTLKGYALQESRMSRLGSRFAIRNFTRTRMNVREIDGLVVDKKVHGGVGWGKECIFSLEGMYGQKEMGSPRHVSAFADGGFVVACAGQYRVVVYGMAGKFERAIGEEGRWKGKFMYPYGVCVQPGTSTFFVTDSENHRVASFNRDGHFICQFGMSGSAPGKLNSPTGVAVNRLGEVFVCDSGNHRISVFTEDGQFLRSLGGIGAGEAELHCLQACAISPRDDTLLVVDAASEEAGTGRLQVLDADSGAVIRRIGEGILFTPCAVSVSAGGDIVVAERDPASLQIFSRKGALLQEVLGMHGKSCCGWTPRGVVVAEDGRILVSQIPNGCVRVFTPVTMR